MKKLLLLAIPLLIASCSSTVEIEKKSTYKCGNYIVTAQFYDDNTMLLVKDGTQHMLTLNEAAPGKKYENIADGTIFWHKNDETYVEVGGRGFPSCKEIVK